MKTIQVTFLESCLVLYIIIANCVKMCISIANMLMLHIYSRMLTSHEHTHLNDIKETLYGIQPFDVCQHGWETSSYQTLPALQ